MQTLRTAVVVVLLLTITYSAYVALTSPPAELPPEMVSIIEGDLHELGPEDFDLGNLDEQGFASLDPLTPADSPPDASSADRITVSTPSAVGDVAALPPATFAPGSGAPAGTPFSTANTLDPTAPPTASPYAQQTGALPSVPSVTGVGTPAAYPTDSTPDSNGVIAQTTANQTLPVASAFADVMPVNSQDQATGSNIEIPTLNENNEPQSTRNGATGIGTDSLALRTSLANAIATADRQCEKEQLREALLTLSLFHNTPGMTAEDREALLPRLDYLAGEVIYSKRHLLEQPYLVTKGESLREIATKLGVPWQLLGTVNGVSDPAAIVPGTELKVIRGPFRAEVNLTTDELTLFLGEYYAGRFPIKKGTDPAPQPGAYVVRDKQTARHYYSGNGPNIPAGDPRNPYGDVWLDLGEQMCIHGSSGASDVVGCIQLRATDAKDIYSILSQGSDVTILR